jgi:O-antigen ligase
VALAAIAVFSLTDDDLVRPPYVVLAFLLAQILACVRSPALPLATAVLSFFLPGLVLFAMMTRRRAEPFRAWMMVWTMFCAVLSLSIIVGWLRYRFGAAVPSGMDVPQAAIKLSGNELLLVPNDICAAAIGMAFPLALLASPEERGVIRAASLVAILLTLAALVILRTRAGFAVVAAELGFCALAFYRPHIRTVSVVMAATLAWVVAWLALHAPTLRFIAGLAEDHGIAGRLGLWVSAVKMFMQAPLLGQGAQSFGPLHAAFLPDWSPRTPERRVLWAHNLFAETLAEQGLVGLACLLALLLLKLRDLWHMAGGTIAARKRMNAVLAGAAVIGFCVAGALELSFVRRVVPLIMFAVLGMAWQGGRQCNVATKKSIGYRGNTS